MDLSMPLGLIYLGSMIEKSNYEVKILDRNLHPSTKYLMHLLKEGWDFVGLATFTNPMLYDAIDVSRIVKENSSSIVIWGGFHVMSVPETTLKHPYVDYILRGEAEESFIKMLRLYEQGKDFSKLEGINLNPLACPPNIEEVPIPNYGLMDLKKYSDFPISTSRGCPYKCSFCYNSYGSKSMKPYRDISIERSIELIEDIVYKYKRKTFTIVDDNFPSDKKRLKTICDAVSKLDIKFNAFSRANYCDTKTLTYMKKCGCWQIDIGVESGNQRILNLLKKGTTVQMNAQAISNCKKVGIFSNALLMIGIPTETNAEIMDTFKFVLKTKPDMGGAAIFYLLPRTKLWDFCKREGWISEPETLEGWADLYPVDFTTPKTNFSEVSNKELLEIRENMNKILNKRRYLKKLKLYLMNKRFPSAERIIQVFKTKLVN